MPPYIVITFRLCPLNFTLRCLICLLAEIVKQHKRIIKLIHNMIQYFSGEAVCFLRNGGTARGIPEYLTGKGVKTWRE